MVEVDSAPWFVAADVCKALGLTNLSVSINALLNHQWSKFALAQRGMGSTICVTETGLYSLVMRSGKPEAQAFPDWVTSTVLPSSRKDVSYINGEEKEATSDMIRTSWVTREVLPAPQ